MIEKIQLQDAASAVIMATKAHYWRQQANGADFRYSTIVRGFASHPTGI